MKSPTRALARFIFWSALLSCSAVTGQPQNTRAQRGCGFVLGFEVKDQITGASVLLGSVSTNRTYYGEMVVVRPVRNGDNVRARILWHTTKRQAWSGGLTLSRHPAVNAVRSFLSDLKKSRKNTPPVSNNFAPNFDPNKVLQTRNQSAVSDRSKAYGITMAGYNQLQTGMSYAEVVKILSSEGVETGSSTASGHRMAMYQWKSRNGQAIVVMFRDDELVSKYQSGL